jgi:hypothetical protein
MAPATAQHGNDEYARAHTVSGATAGRRRVDAPHGSLMMAL